MATRLDIRYEDVGTLMHAMGGFRGGALHKFAGCCVGNHAAKGRRPSGGGGQCVFRARAVVPQVWQLEAPIFLKGRACEFMRLMYDQLARIPRLRLSSPGKDRCIDSCDRSGTTLRGVFLVSFGMPVGLLACWAFTRMIFRNLKRRTS